MDVTLSYKMDGNFIPHPHTAVKDLAILSRETPKEELPYVVLECHKVHEDIKMWVEHEHADKDTHKFIDENVVTPNQCDQCIDNKGAIFLPCAHWVPTDRLKFKYSYCPTCGHKAKQIAHIVKVEPVTRIVTDNKKFNHHLTYIRHIDAETYTGRKYTLIRHKSIQKSTFAYKKKFNIELMRLLDQSMGDQFSCYECYTNPGDSIIAPCAHEINVENLWYRKPNCACCTKCSQYISGILHLCLRKIY